MARRRFLTAAVIGTSALATAVGSGLAIGAGRLAKHREDAERAERGRWKAVTVLAPLAHVQGAEGAPPIPLPQPLAAISDFIDIRFRPAPLAQNVDDGEAGHREDGVDSDAAASTEIAARLSSSPGAEPGIRIQSGTDPDAAIRTALRESKQLIETGEVLRVVPRPEGRRAVTAMGGLVDLAERRAKGKGVL